MCCGSADWKREEVPDHKFDFIDVRDYHNEGWWTRTRYGLLFALVIKSIAVYIADIYTAITLLAFNHFNGSIYNRVQDNPDNTVKVPIQYGKWIFFGCILFSFLLLAYEAHKSRAIIRSRDISYAYTNVMANNYYSLRSYNHFCLFSQINNSTKKSDEIAFFIFFTFKGWKRLIVADGPRQVINALTLYGLVEVSDFSTNVEDYYGGNILTGIMLLTMIFTVVIFAASAILLLIAALMYLPLLCYIKGNLKEYCCHKIDKRITELVQVKKKERVAKQAAIARAEAKGDFKHLMNKKGIIVGQKMVQPTLPKVDVDLFEEKPPTSPAFTAMQRKGTAGGFSPYQHKNQSGEDFGSQAHLVLNQGPGGGSGGGIMGAHSVNGSVDDFGAHNGMAPSLPPSLHNSPDAYPVHVRGPGLMPTDSSTQGLMAQLGPIGTSPQLFAQRMQGNSGGVSRSNSTMDHVINGDATSATFRSPDSLSATRYAGLTATAAGMAPSSPLAGPSTYSPSPLGGGNSNAYQQQQQQHYDQGGYDAGYDQHGGYYHADAAGGDAADTTRAYTGDLSSYAPYHGEAGAGAGAADANGNTLDDVYNSYHADPSGQQQQQQYGHDPQGYADGGYGGYDYGYGYAEGGHGNGYAGGQHDQQYAQGYGYDDQQQHQQGQHGGQEWYGYADDGQGQQHPQQQQHDQGQYHQGHAQNNQQGYPYH